MKVIDSTLIIDFLRNKQNAIEKISKLEEEHKIISTQISVFEVFYGVLKKIDYSALEKTENFFSRIETLDLNYNSSKKTAEIFSHLEKKGEQIDLKDALIAGTILGNGFDTIVTLNKKHFERIPGLKVEEY